MNLWVKLGWRNLWRNRRRSLIELTSIAGGVFLALLMNNLAKGSYAQMIDGAVRMGSGHIGLYRNDYLELRKNELTFETGDLIGQLEDDPSVEAVFPRLHVPGLVRSSRESRPTVIMGIEFTREMATNPLLAPERLEAGELPADDDGRGALMGAVLAEELGLGIGKKFVIMVQDADGEIASRLFRVKGLVRANARMIDARLVAVPRTVLADVIKRPGSAHELAVMLPSHKRIDDVLPRLESIAATVPDVGAFHWEDAMPSIADAVAMDYVGLQIIVVFMYLIVGIGTINTILMSVMERSREFGVVRAIGLGSAGIRRMVTVEAFVLGFVGVATGFILAVLAGLYTSTYGIDYSGMIEDQGLAGALFDPIIRSIWDWTTMLLLSGCMIVLAILGSLYPAHYVLKIKPSDAMRSY